MKKFLLAFATLFCLVFISSEALSKVSHRNEPVICGYVAHSAMDSIKPAWVNRLIYSHMSVDSTLSGITLKNPERLKYVADLRENYPNLDVMVSFGGKPGLLSQSMRNDSLRRLVVNECKKVIDEYDLDGIDIDWEFPGRGEGALSEKEDVANYVKLLRDLRACLGPDKIITIACAGSGYGVDYDNMTPFITQYNIMAYDMGTPPSHHSALYKSDRVHWLCADEAVNNFLAGGVPAAKIVLGMPFYGRGGDHYTDFTDWRDISLPEGCTIEYDSVAEVPWIADRNGQMIFSYDNPYSLGKKCEYIKEKHLAGAMYWRIEEDDDEQTLGRTVYCSIKNISDR